MALAAGITAALSGFGPNPQTTEELLGKVSGRAFVGAVASDPDSGLDAGAVIREASTGAAQSITVITSRGEITVRIDQNTQISFPGGAERLLERISRGMPVRVAILADRPPLGDDGTPTGEPANALKLTVIPAKATREHRRVIVTEKRDADNVTAVDSDGVATNIISGLAFDDGTIHGQAAANIKTDLADQLPEQGESAVLLVRPDLGEGKGERITAVFQARRVLERLSQLAEKAKETEGDSFKSARLENLLIEHIEARGQALEKVRDKAEARFKQIIQRAEERTVATGASREDARGALSGMDAAKADCVSRILGRVPTSKADIPPGQLQRIEAQCFRADRERPQVKLVSPRPGTTLTEDQEVEIRFAAAGPTRESVEILINGELHAFEPETSRDKGFRVRIRVPVGEPVLSVEVRDRTSGTGRESLLKVLYDVREDPPPRLRLVSPTDLRSRQLTPGSTIMLTAHVDSAASLQFSVNEQVVFQAGETFGFNELEYIVPTGVSSLLIQVTATDNLGKTSTVSRLMQVAGDPGPTVEFVSPDARTSISATAPLVVEVKADDNVEVVSVLGVLAAGREESELIFEPILTGLLRMNWQVIASVPPGASSVTAEVTATDNLGNTATAIRTWEVKFQADRPPALEFLAPTDGSAVEEGSTIEVRIVSTDDSGVRSVEIAWPIVGKMIPASLTGGSWVATTVVPELSGAVSSTISNTPPHVFVGSVTIDGSIAHDGTSVTAWIAGGPSSKITLEAVAKDNGGNEATASLALELLAKQIQVGETVVADGSYTLLVSQLQGQSFGGKTVHLRVNGVQAAQSATWQQGGGDELPLSALSVARN